MLWKSRLTRFSQQAHFINVVRFTEHANSNRYIGPGKCWMTSVTPENSSETATHQLPGAWCYFYWTVHAVLASALLNPNLSSLKQATVEWSFKMWTETKVWFDTVSHMLTRSACRLTSSSDQFLMIFNAGKTVALGCTLQDGIIDFWSEMLKMDWAIGASQKSSAVIALCGYVK